MQPHLCQGWSDSSCPGLLGLLQAFFSQEVNLFPPVQLQANTACKFPYCLSPSQIQLASLQLGSSPVPVAQATAASADFSLGSEKVGNVIVEKSKRISSDHSCALWSICSLPESGFPPFTCQVQSLLFLHCRRPGNCNLYRITLQ